MKRDEQFYISFHGIACALLNSHLLSAGLSRDATRGICKGCKTAVRCGVPEVLDKLRPALMEVGSAARVAGEKTIDKVGLAVAYIKVMDAVAHVHLIGLLEVLPRHKVVGELGRKRVESDPFEMIDKREVSCYLSHFLKREHQFYRRAEF